MTLIVEDGSIVTNANTYAAESDMTAAVAYKNITITGEYEQLLLQAMDYIEGLNFIGVKLTKDQPLQWPRYDVYIDGYLMSTDYIPKELIKGQVEVAIAIDQGQDPLSAIARNVKRKKVEGLEIEYSDNASSTTINRTITNALQKLISGASLSGFKVSKA